MLRNDEYAGETTVDLFGIEEKGGSGRAWEGNGLTIKDDPW